ncbi:MAG: hypothetical protein AAGI15_02840 [Pseudomonadota bacterium]
MTQRLTQTLIPILFPGECLACAVDLSGGQTHLCTQCQADLPWCEQPPAIPGIDRTLCALHYEGAVRHWVTQLKFRGDLAAGRLLGTLLLATVRGTYRPPDGPPLPLPTALIPVPMSRWRWFLRGRNQAHVIAMPSVRALSLPILDRAVQVARKPLSAHRLSRVERRTALSAAFRARSGVPTHVAIIDDVLTTGATAQALAAQLRSAGARRVDLWTATYTLPPDAR